MDTSGTYPSLYQVIFIPNDDSWYYIRVLHFSATFEEVVKKSGKHYACTNLCFGKLLKYEQNLTHMHLLSNGQHFPGFQLCTDTSHTKQICN